MERTIFDAEHDMFRASFRTFVDKEVAPHHSGWERDGIVPRDLWLRAGAAGFLGMAVPEEYGGGGVADFRYNACLVEEGQYSGCVTAIIGFTLQNDVVLPYFLGLASDDQKRRWLPGCVTGELITAIAMTEPGTGSDLAGIQTSAVADGDGFVLNGAKTFITNGILADVVIVAAKTDPGAGHRGMTLLVVEAGMDGFERGRNLDKVGLHAQDTAELFFDDVHVPATNVLGEVGGGFAHLMANLPQERLGIAVSAVAGARAAFDWTLAYCKERKAFGQPIGSFQNSRFRLAEMATEIEVAQVFVDRCITDHSAGRLSASDAAKAKWWTTELQKRVVDECVQLHGGYGYMVEYPIARLWADARVQKIYGGTNEIMKELISRSL